MRRLLTSIKRDERTKAKLLGKTVRIWSGEHHAWWRSGRCGYTNSAERAGIYTFEEAYAATKHCGPEKKIAYEVVP